MKETCAENAFLRNIEDVSYDPVFGSWFLVLLKNLYEFNNSHFNPHSPAFLPTRMCANV